MHIHLLGPSGSGVSSLGKLLSETLHIPWFDNDDIFWEKTDPPFTRKRPVEERKEILVEIDRTNESWILSGSMLVWGDFLRDKMDLIIYLYADRDTRIKRLKKREYERFGSRIEKGNDMYENHRTFIEWAKRYETGGLDVRSRISELTWIEKADCRVITIDQAMELGEELKIVLQSISESE